MRRVARGQRDFSRRESQGGIPRFTVTTQVDRLRAEGYKLSRKARIKPFKTFSVSTTVGSSRDESSNSRLKAENYKPSVFSLST
jgi:hypothetical protein